MEVVVSSLPSRIPRTPTIRRGNSDDELLTEDEYCYVKPAITSNSPHPKNRYTKLDNLILAQVANDSTLLKLRKIEEKEQEISTYYGEPTQPTEITKYSNIVKAQLEQEYTSTEFIFNSILESYQIHANTLGYLPPDVKIIYSLIQFNSHTNWTSIKTKLTLSSFTNLVPSKVATGKELCYFIESSISPYLDVRNFFIQLGISGSILRLPSLGKQLLLQAQRHIIRSYILSQQDTLLLPLDEPGQIEHEFQAPMVLFEKNSSSPFEKLGSPQFLAYYTLFLQSHIHIVQIFLQTSYNVKNDKFSELIIKNPVNSIEKSKNNLLSFFKSISCRLKTGCFITLQEVILLYETQLISL